ncbi:MAG TPA: GNAT family N-acetyltransferase [bacterium]|jgi:GNAT superfamily N-acetyltransferase|nr:GNAT family N-acetyltransferase [bacterium]
MAVDVRVARAETEQLPRIVGGREAAPAEWEAWAEEPGHDLVAMDGGRARGGIHVSIVGRTEAWLEALRVHPDAQSRGIAGRLVKEGEQMARHHGAAVIRTAIPAHDYAALGVAERGGYRILTRASVVETEVRSEAAHVPYDAPVETPRPEAAPMLARLLERMPVLTAWERLVPLGWRFRRITPELVRGLVKDRRAAIALQPQRSEEPQAAALFAGQDDAVVVSVLDGSAPGMQALFGELTEYAQERGVSRIVVFTPDAATLGATGVREWRAHPWCPDGLVVVEKSLAS